MVRSGLPPGLSQERTPEIRLKGMSRKKKNSQYPDYFLADFSYSYPNKAR